ncbi:MAG: rhomboid family intramembrane serine protease [Myxococcota bacterium]
MILPVGQSEVLRVPWVTGALILVCLVFFFVTDGEPVAPTPVSAEQLSEAAEYWSEHAYLEVEPEIVIEAARGVPAAERGRYLQDLKHDSYGRWPDAEEMRLAQQEILDFLTSQALGQTAAESGEPSAYARWGLVPDAPRALTFFTHPAFHASWQQLLANLLILFLAGAALEARLGHALVAALLPLAAALSGGASLLVSLDSTQPLIGATGVAAGLVGAALASYRLQRIRCLYVLAIGPEGAIRGSFQLPALVLLPLWLASAIGQVWLPGIELQAHLAGQAAGLISGVAVSLVVGRLAMGERLRFPALGALKLSALTGRLPRPRRRAREDKERTGSAASAPAEGQPPGAAELEALQQAARANPGDVQTVRTFWETAVAVEQAATAAPDMLRLVHHYVGRGEAEAAARTWIEVTSKVPNAFAYPTLLVRLIPALRSIGETEQAAKAVRQAIDPRNRGLTLQNALRAVELAKALDPALAVGAARRALELPDVPLDARALLEALIAETPAPSPAQPAPTPAPSPAGAPAVDSSAGGPRFPGVKIVEGTPTRLAENGLFIQVAAERMIELKYARVEALAAAMVVRSLGQSPEVVIDLALNWNQTGEEALRIVRLRSDGSDAHSLLDDEASLEDVRTLLDKLLTLTRAVPLPDEESARGRPMRVFSDLESYQREVLEVGS